MVRNGIIKHPNKFVTVWRAYVFEITVQYIRCVIPFDEEVMAHRNGGLNDAVIQSGGLNDGLNDGLKPSEKKFLSSILAPDDMASAMAEKLNLGKRTVERALARLQKLGMVDRIGSKRDGRWIVIK